MYKNFQLIWFSENKATCMYMFAYVETGCSIYNFFFLLSNKWLYVHVYPDCAYYMSHKDCTQDLAHLKPQNLLEKNRSSQL